MDREETFFELGRNDQIKEDLLTYPYCVPKSGANGRRESWHA